MGIYAKASKRRLVPVPEGQHQGVCVGIYDCGTQHSDFYKSDSRKLIIVWELPEIRVAMTKNGEDWDVPRIMSRTYTLSMGARANLRQDVEMWRGKSFRDGDEANFDIASMLGQNCMLTVTHSGTGTQVFSNVAGVTALPKGLPVLEPEGECLAYSIDQDGELIPDGTPKWIKEKIMASPEFKELAYKPADDGDTLTIPDPEDVPETVVSGGYLKASDQSECPF